MNCENNSVFVASLKKKAKNPNNGIIMPTILRQGRYRFFFFSNEGFEPRHIHVEAGDGYAKFWFEPVELASSVGCNAGELHEIRRIVITHAKFFKEKWDAYFGIKND